MEIKKLNCWIFNDPKYTEKGVTITSDNMSYNVLDLEDEMITIEFIARSLSRIARYNGHTTKPISVAQHCTQLANAWLLMGNIEYAKIALLHDASEAYMGDCSKPLKNELPKWEEIEDKISEKIAKAFNIKYPYPEDFDITDKNYSLMELNFYMNSGLELPSNIVDHLFWEPEVAENLFMDTYYKILTFEALTIKGKNKENGKS